MELEQLKQLMQMAREFGLIKLEFQDVKLEFSTTQTLPASQDLGFQITNDTTHVHEKRNTPANVELSNEDLLFYSVEEPAALTAKAS